MATLKILAAFVFMLVLFTRGRVADLEQSDFALAVAVALVIVGPTPWDFVGLALVVGIAGWLWVQSTIIPAWRERSRTKRERG